MRLFIALMALAMLLIYAAPRPAFDKSDGRALLMEPYFLRAISGFGRCVVADFMWMKSHLIGEVSLGDNVNLDVVVKVFGAQIILDAQYIVPVRYAATYLASLPKRPDLSIDLLTLSESLNRERFDLLIIEALIRINYDVPDSSDRLVELAKIIEALPDVGDKRKLVGSMKMDDFMIELINYSRTKEGKAQLIEDDLLELWCMTTNADRLVTIESELKRARAERGEEALEQSELRAYCRADASER
ncbi:hypothetical protein FACS189487_08470 [Campylobacterota bacterium]|nr:hypothetical protein FACS189487_08470 [Campylobacterota bacterium]